jgi:hypothetical protein
MLATALLSLHDCDQALLIESLVLAMEHNRADSRKRYRDEEHRCEWDEINETPIVSGAAYVAPVRFNTVEELSTVLDLRSRSRKWTKPEEEYTNALIKYFDCGQISDGFPGETLRKYLCRKIACKEMRISKKFSGTLIGKVF